MANEILPFDFESNAVRVVMINEEPWWVLVDVGRVLGISSPHQLADRLKYNEKRKLEREDLPMATRDGIAGGIGSDVWLVNEKGLNRVIFRSDKPEADRLQDWVFGEVLPSIRKTGRYESDKRAQLESEWRERIEVTVPSHCALVTRYMPGHFSIMMAASWYLLGAEREILLHDIKTYDSDRMDGSIGYHWAKYYRKRFRVTGVRHPQVTIDLPGVKFKPHPLLYPDSCFHMFKWWLIRVYIPHHQTSYIFNKDSFKSYPIETKASAANNLSILYSGKPAVSLPDHVVEKIRAMKKRGIHRIRPSDLDRQLPDVS